ncbi:TilS substrate-binding domain-containing protein, partial [Skermania piniformis]
AVELLTNAGAGAGLSVAVLAAAPPAVRRRTVRAWLRGAGVTASTDRHLRAVDRLVTDWHGQGPVAVGGAGTGARLVVARRHGRLALERAVVS